MNFLPTFLYIKQHSITKKCYFGKTTKNPETYLGSGLHWKRHILLHGPDNVETLWYSLFYDKDECVKFALLFSEQQEIVESDNWLNVKKENGLDGGGRDGSKHSPETKAKMALARLGKPQSKETIAKRAAALRGKPLSQSHKEKISSVRTGSITSEETKKKISLSSMGRIQTIESREKISFANLTKRLCPHCGMNGGAANMSRYHFDKCKEKL